MVAAVHISDNFATVYAMSAKCLHAIDSVQDQPQTTLTHWQLIKVRSSDGTFTRHLKGRADGEGRASSSIVVLDIVGLQATTQSGRIYVLEQPGRDGDADWVFGNWLRINACTQHSDQTRALLRLHAGKVKVAR